MQIIILCCLLFLMTQKHKFMKHLGHKIIYLSDTNYQEIMSLLAPLVPFQHLHNGACPPMDREERRPRRDGGAGDEESEPNL